MSTAGQAAGGVLGAIAGFFTPLGPLYGAQIGMMIGGYLDPVKTTVNNPRLSDLTLQTSTYGAPIARTKGTIAVTGNLFWLEGNEYKEVIRKKKSGGKGGSKVTTNTPEYYATFAIGLCKNEIAGVRRIWARGVPIYDAGSSDLATIIASNEASALFSLYLGSSTQLPDDRIQADMGVANTSAYRGLAYIVFKDFPLRKFGDTLAGVQIKAEIVTSGSATNYVNVREEPFGVPFPNSAFSPIPAYMDLERVIFYVPQWINDYPASSSFIKHEIILCGGVLKTVIPCPGTSIQPNLFTTDKSKYLYSATQVFTLAAFSADQGKMYEHDGTYVGLSQYDPASALVKTLYVSTGLPASQRTFTANADDHSIAFDGTYIYLLGTTATRKLDLNFNVVATGVGLTGDFVCARAYVSSDGFVYCVDQMHTDGKLYRLSTDLSSISLIKSNIGVYDAGGFANFIVENNIAVFASPKYDARLLQLTTINLETGVSSSPPTLGSIVQSECLKSNLLTLSDIDTSALTQTVRGYKVSNVASIRSALEPLQAAWPFDVIQDGYTLRFIPRGGASVATIPAADLNARSADDEPGISIVNTREMDSQLPRRVTLTYLDPDREYDIGEQYSERLNSDAVNVKAIELAIVLTSQEAARIVEVLRNIYWLERNDLSFSLPPTYSRLQSADSITILADDATYFVRLTSVTYSSDGRLECKAKYSSAAAYISTATGEAGQSTGQTLSLPGSTETAMLDIPCLLDSLDGPGFPVGMAGYLAGWPGASLIVTNDSGQTWEDLQSFIPPGTVMGTATTSIPAVSNALIDKASKLTIVVISGSLSSVTELAMLSGSNYFAYGVPGRWEIIAAQTCTLQGDGSYILTDMLRGQQGTEWTCGLHAIGDRVVELDSSTLAFVSTTSNSIGLTKTYRGITLGKQIDSASDISFAYTGVNLECLSPIYLNGNRHPTTNDWALTWIRRTRVGGAWRDFVDVSLGEASEAYEVEIFSSNTYVTLKRTITGLTTAAAAYTSAQQVTDFGSNQSTLYIKIYQMSATVGRGYPLITSISR